MPATDAAPTGRRLQRNRRAFRSGGALLMSRNGRDRRTVDANLGRLVRELDDQIIDPGMARTQTPVGRIHSSDGLSCVIRLTIRIAS